MDVARMYGKIFQSIYDGSLADNWEALVTFQQMITLCDQDGVIDMTPRAMAARTGIPREIIDKGIEILEAPDPDSRSSNDEGRRIRRLDEHRSWGWEIVNHKHYRQLVSAADKREKDRERLAKKREKNDVSQPVADRRDVSQPVATCRGSSHHVANVAHTDTDTDTKADASTEQERAALAAPTPYVEQDSTDGQKQTRTPTADIDAVVTHYQTYHPRSKPGAKERRKIGERLREGRTVADLCLAIDGCHVSPHHCGDNERGIVYQSLELIVRDAKHVDDFIAHAEGKGSVRITSERERINQQAVDDFLQMNSGGNNGQRRIEG